jgi:hypothetical protein
MSVGYGGYVRRSGLVRGLEESRTESPVYLDRAPNDSLGEIRFEKFHSAPPRLRGEQQCLRRAKASGSVIRVTTPVLAKKRRHTPSGRGVRIPDVVAGWPDD